MSYDGYGYGYRYEDDDVYENRGNIDPNLTRSISKRVFKLSTQTNIVMFGYLLLMVVNHMTLGETIFSDTVKFDTTITNGFKMDANKRTWTFALIIFFIFFKTFPVFFYNYKFIFILIIKREKETSCYSI